MTKTQRFLATFRIDEELWGKFKDIAKNKQTNASALIIQYIQGVISSGGVDNPPKATPQNIDISPQPNLDDIYKYIDNKLDNLEDVSIQDIDNKIAESLEDGDIKDAIAASYAGMMAQFNGLLEELQDLKSQLQELQSNPPAAVPINEQLTIDNEEPTTDNGQFTNEILTTLQETDNGQLTKDIECDSTPKPEKQRLDPAIYTRNYQIVSMLGCQFWMDGKKFNNQDLKENEIDKNIATNKVEIESMLGIEIILKDKVIHRFVKILRAMKFEIKGNQTDGYYIANPDIY